MSRWDSSMTRPHGFAAIGPGLAGLGPVRQLAYVVPNLAAAMRFWTHGFGIGPFFHAPRSRQTDALWKGCPVTPDFSLALSYWGDMQIELIQPNDPGPSFYRESLTAGHNGLHHVCVYTDNMVEARRRLAVAGAELVFEGKLAQGGELLYADPGGDCGFYFEILKPPPFLLTLFAGIRHACAGWDGNDPVRPLG